MNAVAVAEDRLNKMCVFFSIVLALQKVTV